MSEKTEEALIKLFKEKMNEISQANKKLRIFMYTLISVFSVSLICGIYWGGMISERVNNINSNVEKMTRQTEEIRDKYDHLVFFMAREFKYNPSGRGEKDKGNS